MADGFLEICLRLPAAGRTESRHMAYSRMEALARAARPQANCTCLGRAGIPRLLLLADLQGDGVGLGDRVSNLLPGWTSWVK